MGGTCFLSVSNIQEFIMGHRRNSEITGPQSFHRLIIPFPLLHQDHPANFSLNQISR